MNVLILSCGTRCKLVEYFKNRENGFDKVVVTDCNELAPALYFADKYYIVSKMSEPSYFDEIHEICEKEKVDVVVPLHEEEIILISKNINWFQKKKILVAVSDYKTVELCRDKYKVYKYLNENKISAIETKTAEQYLNEEGTDRDIFVKPRFGAGSVGTLHIKSYLFLKAFIEEYNEQYVIQPYIQGKEYGVDAYVDFITGEITAIFCKEKLRMRAGETEKSVSVRNSELEKLIRATVKKTGLRGPIDIDVLEQHGKFYILEINPRFGGGYPHAYECGINFVKMLYMNSIGKENSVVDLNYETGIVALKYSEIITK